MTREVDEALLELLKAGIKDGSLRDDLPPRISTGALFGMINWTHRWFRPNGKLTGKQVAAIFSDILLNGMRKR